MISGSIVKNLTIYGSDDYENLESILQKENNKNYKCVKEYIDTSKTDPKSESNKENNSITNDDCNGEVVNNYISNNESGIRKGTIRYLVISVTLLNILVLVQLALSILKYKKK